MSRNFNWLSALFLGLAVGLAPEAGLPAEAICGYGTRLVAVPAGSQRTGLSVEMLTGDVAVDQTVPLRFRVRRMPGDVPVDELQVEHEKLMHVIGVRVDLGEFFHIHPQRTAPGLWQVIHTFTNGGRYQIWSDIKERGTVYSFAQPVLAVTGKIRPTPAAVVPKLQDFKAGYQISLDCPDVLRAGKTNQLRIVVRDSTGKQVGMEFFLGALMHLVLVKDDLSVYLHGHAENHDKSQTTIFFNQMFPQPGSYKLFAQFRPIKTKLPPDEAILAEFWVKVAKAE
jgi:hypothetical protein